MHKSAERERTDEPAGKRLRHPSGLHLHGPQSQDQNLMMIATNETKKRLCSTALAGAGAETRRAVSFLTCLHVLETDRQIDRKRTHTFSSLGLHIQVAAAADVFIFVRACARAWWFPKLKKKTKNKKLFFNKTKTWTYSFYTSKQKQSNDVSFHTKHVP